MCRGVLVHLGWCRAEGLGQELPCAGIRTASGIRHGKQFSGFYETRALKPFDSQMKPKLI